MTLHTCSLPYCDRCQAIADSISDACERIRSDPLALADAIGYVPESIFGDTALLAALADRDAVTAGEILLAAVEDAIAEKAYHEIERNAKP